MIARMIERTGDWGYYWLQYRGFWKELGKGMATGNESWVGVPISWFTFAGGIDRFSTIKRME